MLKSSRDLDKQAAVKCLQGMTNKGQYCQQILDANGIDQLVTILRANKVLNSNPDIASSQQTLILNTLSVLCNLSDNSTVREHLSAIKDLGSILIKLLESPSTDDIQSRAAIVLADVSYVNNENRTSFAQQGCLDKLIKLLDSDIEDVLVNTINAIEVLCTNNKENQNTCAQYDVFLYLIDLLNLNSGRHKSV